MNQQNREGLTIKDLVTTGIFSALFFIFTMIGGIPFGANPVLTFYLPFGCALLCGPIYLLLVAKVHKRGSITILGCMMALIMFMTGMHWAMAIGYLAMGILADIVAGAGNYHSKKMNAVSYMILSLGATYSYMVFFIDPEGWAGTMLKNGTEQSYIDTMKAAAPSWMPILIIVGTLVIAAFSAWVGSKMLKKQFEKAGILA